MKSAITLLEEQHREVDDLFEEYEGLKDDASEEKLELFQTIADRLAVHATIEEKIFYPSVKVKATEDILLESVEEHLTVKRVIADLLELSASDEHFDAKVKVLKDIVQHHVQEERQELFPQVRRLFTRDELANLAEEMEKMVELLVGSNPRETIPAETGEAAPLN